MKKLAFALTLSFGVLFFSCSKDDDGSGSTDNGTDNSTPSGQKYKKRLLIEDFTSTGCSYCPRVMYGIQKVEEETNYAEAVAIHLTWFSGTFESDKAEELIDATGASGLPAAFLNRKITWSSQTSTTQPLGLINDSGNVGLALKVNVDSANGTYAVDVKTSFGKDVQERKLVVYMLEDDVIADQINGTTFFPQDTNSSGWMVDWKHKHLQRKCLTHHFGDAIAESDSKAGSEKTYSFSGSIPSGVNAAKISFVAFVVDGFGLAENVRSAHHGDDQDFEKM